MSKFKVGDLALVVGADKAISNIGKCVELVRFVKTGEKLCICGIIGVSGDDAWVIAGDNLAVFSEKAGSEIFGGEGLALEKNLMPLRGDFTPETMKEMELTQ